MGSQYRATTVDDRSTAQQLSTPEDPPSVDVAELCGGAADVAYMLVRSGFVHGLNFDITVGFNLRTPGHRTFFVAIPRLPAADHHGHIDSLYGHEGVQCAQPRHRQCRLAQVATGVGTPRSPRRCRSTGATEGWKAFHRGASPKLRSLAATRVASHRLPE